MGIWTRRRSGRDLGGLIHHSDKGVHAGNEAEDKAAELAMASDQEQIVKQKR